MDPRQRQRLGWIVRFFALLLVLMVYPIYFTIIASFSDPYAVVNGEADCGILVCGTGIGMSLAANKIPGIRCALLSDCFSAEMCRAHNNANMCALGGRVTGPELAKRMVDLFLTTEFLGGRHADRVNMISALENHDR